MVRDCATCRANRHIDRHTRQAMGCAYEPSITSATPWTPPAMLDAGELATACPGYTTTLPAVREVVVLYPHWERGTLTDALGDTPCGALLDGLVALQGGIRERDSQAHKDAMNGKAGA